MVLDFGFFLLLALTIMAIASGSLIAFWNGSIVRKMMTPYISGKIWMSKSKEITHEGREFCRDFGVASATVGGISLAVVAFLLGGYVDKNTNVLPSIYAIVGVASVLFAAILFFWSFALSLSAASYSEDDSRPTLTTAVFNFAFYIFIYGLFAFFVGLIWSFSSLNFWLGVYYFIAYFFIWVGIQLIIPAMEKRVKASFDR